MSGCGTDIPTRPCQIKITFVNIGNKLKIKFNGMFSITLHNSNKQDSLTIVIISVSTLGMYRHGWPHMLKMWTFMDALNSFLRYFKDNANLLFYELWACWPCPSKIIASTCWKLLTFICRQKINVIPYIFLEILQKILQIAILGTLNMPGQSTLKMMV